MLKEIICNEFNQKQIIFNKGLNTILGDDNATNSIGKSTLLMIIDFVFGGSDYLKSIEIFNNIGHHSVQYCFEFVGCNYYFTRKTADSQTVYICNDIYDVTDEISIEKYNEFLYNKYQINLYATTFRGVVGRYLRIYGKENLDEKKPLKYIGKEKEDVAIIALLKLFNKYHNLEEFEKNSKEKKDRLSAFKSAMKYKFISKITKTEFTKNIKHISDLELKADNIATEISSNCIDLETVQLEQVSILKNNISSLKRQRSKYNATLVRLSEGGVLDKNNFISSDLDELISLFPNVNIRKIEKITTFHETLQGILSTEIESQIKLVQKQIDFLDSGIDDLTDKIKEIINTKNPSKLAIDNLLCVQKQIETLKQQNSLYSDSIRYDNEMKDAKLQSEDIKTINIQSIQNVLNNHMEQINNYIYSNKQKSPIINIEPNRYTFSTPDDTGTGTSYKNMIVYDLSVLELTKLPILIHDSVVHKQVAYSAMDKIMEKYVSYDTKQIFIAFDGILSYSKQTQKILLSSEIIKLEPNGSELFGRSWNKK